MKFIHYLEKITGVDVYGISSFLIFFTIFLAMLLWAWRADRSFINKMSHLPFDTDELSNPKNNA